MKKDIRDRFYKQIKLMNLTLQNMTNARRDYDSCRNMISSSINILMNTDWGVQSESMKRGEIMGHLKSAETILNMSVSSLISVEVPYKNEIYWLQEYIDKNKNKKKKEKNNG
jgi:hypothetical protein